MRSPVLDAPTRTQGIVSSGHGHGWLGKRWITTLNDLDDSSAERVARGRTFARRGRVQDLWFSPGLATAVVADGDEEYHVSVRVRIFEPSEWDIVVDTLVEDLQRVAGIIEGSVPRSLVTALAKSGLNLVPSTAELDGDCDCGDYRVPCVHTAAVHHLLADALDGDAFLLFTLRGYNREELVERLRVHWGAPSAVTRSTLREPEPAPRGDWFTCPEPLPAVAMDLRLDAVPRSGLDALGPAPDRAQLGPILLPLYEAASKATLQAVLDDVPDSVGSRRHARTLPPAHPTPKESSVSEEKHEQPTLTERIVNELASVECAKSRDLARRLDVPMASIRNELLELEEMGVVIRTGKTRGTRWWLG